MGGIFTSVRDPARWVAGFADAFPARDDPEAGHPLSRASRREMQQVHRDLDEPRGLRSAQLAAARERVGRTEPDPDDPPTSDSPSHLRWRLRGERGRLRVGLLASAEATPRIQALRVLAVPDPDPAFAAVAERVVALLADDIPRWPAHLPVAQGVDAAALERGLRAARLLLGSGTLGRPLAGDGERGRGELRLELDEAGAVKRAAVVPGPLVVPPEAP